MSNEQRTNAKIRFAKYVENYNPKDPKIALKIAHTYRVADLCEAIAKSINLGEEDVEIAWMCGLLHDIGRFEQIRRFNTFSDADSIDHAHLSCEILFDEKDGIIRDFVTNETWDDLIYKAIYNHSAFRVEEGLMEREMLFCNILRDADKVDIFRVQCDTPFEEIYNTTTEALINSEITPEVFEDFMSHICILRAKRRTPMDIVVSMVALYFELVYDFSKEEARRQGYINKILEVQSNNSDTREKLEIIRRELGV